MREAAPAKLNFYLHVTGRRPDGYHLLDSLVVFAGVGDVLSVAPSERLGLDVVGPFAAGLTAESDNLVLRAARLLAEAADIVPRGRLLLEKNLPVASGIGGGSADAAATLRLLARHWALPDDGLVARLAPRLGADVPVCLAGQAARMSGIGEVLAPAPALPDVGVLLANPGVPLSTPAVFAARAGGFSQAAPLPAVWPDAAAMAADLAALSNDLEAPAVRLCPPVAELLAALRRLPGCLLARMSGSGATCFALFTDAATAVRARAEGDIRAGWVWAGALQSQRIGSPRRAG